MKNHEEIKGLESKSGECLDDVSGGAGLGAKLASGVLAPMIALSAGSTFAQNRDDGVANFLFQIPKKLIPGFLKEYQITKPLKIK